MKEIACKEVTVFLKNLVISCMKYMFVKKRDRFLELSIKVIELIISVLIKKSLLLRKWKITLTRIKIQSLQIKHLAAVNNHFYKIASILNRLVISISSTKK